jgi:hypothetical protein
MPNITFYITDKYYKKLTTLGSLLKKLKNKNDPDYNIKKERKKDTTVGLTYFENGYVDDAIAKVKLVLKE